MIYLSQKLTSMHTDLLYNFVKSNASLLQKRRGALTYFKGPSKSKEIYIKRNQIEETKGQEP